jgi:hypothetical protein
MSMPVAHLVLRCCAGRTDKDAGKWYLKRSLPHKLDIRGITKALELPKLDETLSYRTEGRGFELSQILECFQLP